MRNRQNLFFILLFFPVLCFAQNRDQTGLLPSINFNKKLERDWSLNFKFESRQMIYRDGFEYQNQLNDLSFAAAKKLGINTTLAIGYLMRITEDGITNRSIQQVSFVRRYPDFRLAHRFSSDQTFKSDNMELRLRYRASAEIPLNGQSLDPNEFFLKINNEYLNSFYKEEYDLEIRLAGFAGYTLSPQNKLELGVDYRVDSFIENNSRNRYWIALSFYQSI